MDVVAYVRVSTKSQGESGLGQEAQLDYIHTAAKQQGWNIIATYSDVLSGSVAPQDRPQMAKALSHGLPIVAAKIDRISRDVEHMASLMKRATLKIATMPQADNFQLHLFAALAEQERAFIRTRIKDALGALKQRADDGCIDSQAKIERRSLGLQKAREKGNVSVMNEVKASKQAAHLEEIAPHVMACLYKGVSTLQALSDCLNNKGKWTVRGGEWNPTTVRRLMLSLGVSFSK
ncbi:serine recombinase [Pseudomonas coronafaciens pv. porri]|uniref:Serine recombinase n=1 Tax=Pseudomonas coronafaciens pv. porri TaxID=83964 RepID=A0ABR5JPQ8_9PSED|nr:recombinase family protein [Pseudomonas coronafaciens]KOP51113.1 serine recombinase [Pseudomonas coronafaciens pv. porri]KOP59425.1 serine recombinase [Pseudomonas coronafaciens pv. porri]KPY21933.1 Resolvase-like protein [Pseudomonas coronafaciens pv. porri]RMU82786.1 Resolvase-like protein [Pseudomonas coronafaciens pv. porri]RMW03300.1 Resolvase-like protein [Pseudomonas coronafaciens pv. porri]